MAFGLSYISLWYVMTLLEHDRMVWNRAAAMYAGSVALEKLILEGFFCFKDDGL